MDRAGDWLRPTAATWQDRTRTWNFPSGFRLAFGHLEVESDKYEYQSSEFQYIGIDEAGQLEPSQIQYMHSRMRAPPDFPSPVKMRLASNPGGPAHDYLYERYIDPKTRHRGCAFVQALLDDNPHINQAEYITDLEQLDSLTFQQLRFGVWVRDGNGLVYRYDRARNRVSELPSHDANGFKHEWMYILVVDFGGSQVKPTEGLAVLAFSFTSPFTYVMRARKVTSNDIGTTAAMVHRWERDFGGFTRIVMDQGGLGGKIIAEMRNRYGIAGVEAMKANKLGFRRLVNGALERGELRIVESECEQLIEELEHLEWDKDGLDCKDGQDDHLTDCMLYGYRESRAYLAEATRPPPKPGTEEYEAQREAELLEQDDANLLRQDEEEREAWNV